MPRPERRERGGGAGAQPPLAEHVERRLEAPRGLRKVDAVEPEVIALDREQPVVVHARSSACVAGRGRSILPRSVPPAIGVTCTEWSTSRLATGAAPPSRAARSTTFSTLPAARPSLPSDPRRDPARHPIRRPCRAGGPRRRSGPDHVPRPSPPTSSVQAAPATRSVTVESHERTDTYERRHLRRPRGDVTPWPAVPN